MRTSLHRFLIAVCALLAVPVARAESTNSAGKDLVIGLGGGQAMEFVRIESAKLWVGKYEVTNGQFKRFKPEHDSGMYRKWSLNADDQPVVRVSWDEAQAFCKWLNDNHGKKLDKGSVFRLPTEKEWTAFACSDTDSVYPWGDGRPQPATLQLRPPPGDWNYGGEECARRISGYCGGIEPFRILGHKDGFPVTCRVTESGVNARGVYGVGGNVWEWCLDWWDKPEKTFRVVRGGAWDSSYEKDPRELLRSGAFPDERCDTIGFRVLAAGPGRTGEQE